MSCPSRAENLRTQEVQEYVRSYLYPKYQGFKNKI